MSEIPWQSDEEGDFFVVRSNHGTFDVRPDNAQIFKHGERYKAIDHIFRFLDDDNPTRGYFVWRHVIEDTMGMDFDEFVDDMKEHGFVEIHQDVAEESDIEAWQNATHAEFEPEKLENNFPKWLAKLPIEQVFSLWREERKEDVALVLEDTLKTYDAEFDYYLGANGEWRTA